MWSRVRTGSLTVSGLPQIALRARSPTLPARLAVGSAYSMPCRAARNLERREVGLTASGLEILRAHRESGSITRRIGRLRNESSPVIVERKIGPPGCRTEHVSSYRNCPRPDRARSAAEPRRPFPLIRKHVVAHFSALRPAAAGNRACSGNPRRRHNCQFRSRPPRWPRASRSDARWICRPGAQPSRSRSRGRDHLFGTMFPHGDLSMHNAANPACNSRRRTGSISA